jgi:cell division protein FtsZ
VEDFEPVRPVATEPVQQFAPEAPKLAEEPRVVAVTERVAAPIPVVVDHIPEVRPGSEMPRPVAEGSGGEGQGVGQGVSQGAPVARESTPELVPVRASVFDDDFFRRPKDELAARAGEDAASKPWPDARVPSFAGYAGESTPENDELDIPAFLRRKT